MNEDKLSSDEVPLKFAEWLLAMGCPAEKVPAADKMALMCRGQYYMVWRSLMEHVYSKNVIREKRLQVFCNDIKLSQKKTAFSQNSNVVPEPLSLWQQQKDLKEKVYDAENRLKQSQEVLNQLMEKIIIKLSQRNVIHKHIQNLQRRVWFLQQVSEELQYRKENLEETRTIANSLCLNKNDNEIQGKVDNTVAALRRQVSQASTEASLLLPSSANPVASSSAVSIQGETTDYGWEELVSSLARRGDEVWGQLRGGRAGLAAALQAANARERAGCKPHPRSNPQTVLAHTASLHCSLALESMKNRVHIKQTQARLASSISDLNTNISGESCELLVLRCEKACSEAKVNALRTLLNELQTRNGPFRTNGEEVVEKNNTLRRIETTDKAIELKRDELRKLITSLTITERKINNVKECLVSVFNSFHKNSPVNENYQNKGVQLDFPKESISTLRQFYEERRERRIGKPDLSLDFEVSDYSFSDAVDGNPRFVEELKIYLRKFNLENNRKLVLESGEKIWIFETIQSLIGRLHTRWLSEDVSCSLLSPLFGLQSLHHLGVEVAKKGELAVAVRRWETVAVENDTPINIQRIAEQEAGFVDKMKKSIGSNLTTLQQCKKTLEVGQENLKFWADNELKKYISDNRTVDGKTYKEYETLYLDNLV
ncbi:unnamed protein product, partial [Iphiclides podalirius]